MMSDLADADLGAAVDPAVSPLGQLPKTVVRVPLHKRAVPCGLHVGIGPHDNALLKRAEPRVQLGTSVTTDGATVPMSATTACGAASTGERIAPLTGPPARQPARAATLGGRRFAGVTPGGAPTCPRNTARSSHLAVGLTFQRRDVRVLDVVEVIAPGPPVLSGASRRRSQYAHAREGHRAGAALGVDRGSSPGSRHS